MARPRKPIDENLVEGLAGIGCTDLEISRLAGCSVDTLNRRCADILDKGRQTLKMKLRRWQLQAAERGSTAMLIFLGKQILGQRDTIQVDVNQLESDIERELAIIAAGRQADTSSETEEQIH